MKPERESGDIYNMKLHDTINIRKEFAVTRVPGGWLYEGLDLDVPVNSSFVPWHNEFQQQEEGE